MDKQQQELIYKFSIFEKQIKQLKEQINVIENAILDIETLNNEIEELKGSKDKEILAAVGRGIYAKAKLISEELFVDVGEGNLVKKDIDSTKKIIEKQIKKLKEIQKDLDNAMNSLNQEMTKTFLESQKKQDFSCEDDSKENCECDDDCDCNKDNCRC